MARLNRSGGAICAAVVAVSLLAGLTTSVASAQQLLTCQQVLTCGDLIPCSIDAAAEVDFFTFEAQAGDDIFLTLVETGGWGGSPDPQATLFDPMNVALLTFDATSTQRFAIEASGTYVVRLRANNLFSTGSYSLGLEYLPLRPCGVIIVEKQTLPDRAPDLFEFSGDAAGFIADGT